jgi:DNA mismatch repair protein MutS2
MNDKTLSDLEFDAIRESLRLETSTPLGAMRAPSLRPATAADEVLRANGLTLESVRHLEERGALPFGTLTDPEPVLGRLGVTGSDASPLEIQELLAVMKSGRDVKSSLAMAREAFPRLWGEARDLPDLGNLIRFLDGKIGPQGEVLDHASDDLMTIRRDIRRASGRLEERLQQIVSRPEIAHVLQDDYVALRSERHVIPIRSESRHAVQGIVHGISGSGATVFVEPIETVELNNELVTLRELQAAEIRRLLREYSELLRGRLAELRLLAEGLGRLDLVMARGRLARAMKAVPADISSSGAILLRGARHPLVERSLRDRGAAIVPLDLDMAPAEKVLVISGPNTGGKTVALKTVGLLALMHQSGLFVPALQASLPLLRTVFIDIGDRQSIQDRLSTFSARVTAIARMTLELELPGLVLLDEIGTGTDPEEGVALGIAVVDYFHRRGARVIVTTHLEALKAWAAVTPDCSNAAMQFDESTGAPTYRLAHGVPGRSSALEIAGHLGLPPEILDQARSRRGTAGRLLDEYLLRLERQSSALEARLGEVVRERADLAADRTRFEADMREREERLRASVAAEIETSLSSMREEGQRYLESLRDQEVLIRLRRDEARLAGRLRDEARRQIRRVAPDLPEPAAQERLTAGARVRVASLDLPGVVQEIKGDRVVLLVRGKRVVSSRAECELIDVGAPPPGRSGPTLPPGIRLQRSQEEASGSLDLRGMLVEDAIERVDKFLDNASLDALPSVRLVHGVGSGRLRRAVRDLLSRHPHVGSFAAASDQDGGEGTTVVTLRD